MFLDLQFYTLPLAMVGLLLLAVTLLAAEVGFRLGRRARSNADEATRSQLTAIEGGVLGVVGLLLAFSFGMSVSRFENRKEIVVHEANAIGTAYLRAQLLPQPERREVESMFRRYVDAWLEVYEAASDQQRRAGVQEIDRLEGEIWSRAVAVARQKPDSLPMSLLLQSLNEVFDRKAELIAAVANRVPGMILLLLILGTAVSLGQVGYGCGVAGRRSVTATLTLCFLVAAIILVIFDLDRPRRGLLQVSPQSMIALRESISPSRVVIDSAGKCGRIAVRRILTRLLNVAEIPTFDGLKGLILGGGCGQSRPAHRFLF